MKRLSKSKIGFTLVEIMLVLAMIVILVAAITIDVIGAKDRANVASSVIGSEVDEVAAEALTGEESLAALGF